MSRPRRRTLVAPIMAIIAFPPSIVSTGGGWPHQPPKCQEEHQEHAIAVIGLAPMALLPLPSTTFHILKGGLDPHAPAILANAHWPGRPIRNQEPGVLMSGLPDGAQVDFQVVFLPQTHFAIPGSCLPVAPGRRLLARLARRGGAMAGTAPLV